MRVGGRGTKKVTELGGRCLAPSLDASTSRLYLQSERTQRFLVVKAGPPAVIELHQPCDLQPVELIDGPLLLVNHRFPHLRINRPQYSSAVSPPRMAVPA